MPGPSVRNAMLVLLVSLLLPEQTSAGTHCPHECPAAAHMPPGAGGTFDCEARVNDHCGGCLACLKFNDAKAYITKEMQTKVAPIHPNPNNCRCVEATPDEPICILQNIRPKGKCSEVDGNTEDCQWCSQFSGIACEANYVEDFWTPAPAGNNYVRRCKLAEDGETCGVNKELMQCTDPDSVPKNEEEKKEEAEEEAVEAAVPVPQGVQQLEVKDKETIHLVGNDTYSLSFHRSALLPATSSAGCRTTRRAAMAPRSSPRDSTAASSTRPSARSSACRRRRSSTASASRRSRST